MFNLDQEEDRQRVVPAVLELALHPEEARNKALAARARVAKHHQEMVATLQLELDKL
ncbi:hypothetical protein D3C84_1300960 [compost metagenome]